MYGRILKLLGHLTGLMILISAGWTALNIVALIGTSNPVGYGVALMFDMAWLVAVAVQHELRYRVDLRGRLAGIGWSLTALSSALNATSELATHHGVAIAVVAAIVPALAKGCLALKLFTEQDSSAAKERFGALAQSWQDRVTELRITEAMAAQWHQVERVHENRDAERLAVTQADRFANLELTAGSETPITRAADPVVWEPPAYPSPLVPTFIEPAPAPSVAPAEPSTEHVPVPRVPFGFAMPVTTAQAAAEPQVPCIVAALSQPTTQATPAAFTERTEANRRRRAEALSYMSEHPATSVADVAERYGVSVRTVQRWTKAQA